MLGSQCTLLGAAALDPDAPSWFEPKDWTPLSKGLCSAYQVLFIAMKSPYPNLSLPLSEFGGCDMDLGDWDPDPDTRISKLDISDLLHLHPNDTIALTVVSIKLKYYAMIELPKCGCNAYESFKKHNQLLKLMQFLMVLDDSYMQIRSSILSKEVLPDVRSAYATIFSEESHRVAAGSIAGSSQRNQAFAFVSNVPNKNNFQRNSQNMNSRPRPNNMNKNRQGGGSGLVCENCGFNGHTIDRCFKIIGYHADFVKKKSNQSFKGKNISNNNFVGTSSSSRFTNKQMATLISLIKDNKIGKNVQANMAGFESEKCYGDWLGHPADPVLNVLKKSLQIDSNDKNLYFKVCQSAKQTREPFALSILLTVVDDYTRAVWVYLIKSKDEVSHFITVFYNLIENQFKRKIKIFRSDNGTEFVNQYVNKFYENKGGIPLRIDKFGSRSEKCVMIGYSSVKKRYRLYSLDKNQFIFSKDVKFFKNIFPFKDSDKVKNDTANLFQDVNHTNFFDLEYPEFSNDDERVDPKLNSDNKSQSATSSSSKSGRNTSIANFLVNSKNDADRSDNVFATQNEGLTTLEENIFFEGNLDQNLNSSSQDVQNLRRSSRQSVFPRNYNDFVVDSKVKYGIEKYVGYSKLNTENYCFIT
ncbi:ribonuclease H-like domain-containing protein [Tanacetum coccineum]